MDPFYAVYSGRGSFALSVYLIVMLNERWKSGIPAPLGKGG